MIRFIATRLNKATGAGQVSRPAIIIATAGVAIGLMVMILTICVAFGFKRQIRDMVRETGGDLQIFNSGSIIPNDRPSIIVTDNILNEICDFPGVENAERVATTLGCLKTDSAFLGIQLVGRESQQMADDEIIISTMQAAKLDIAVGDKIMTYFFDNKIRARRFTVIGTYATHLNDFDATQVFASFPTVQKLTDFTDDECNFIQVYKEKGGDTEKDILAFLKHVKRLIPLTPTCQPTVSTLEELHPQVFSWLGLLDLNVWVILILMICVSGFTMASGLFILILERTQMIGLMKALGAKFSTLRHIFLYLAGIILVRGMVIGNTLALLLAFVQKEWHVVKLNPVDYYVDSVPIELPWREIILLNICTMFLTLLVLIIPTYIIGHISPVKAMRFD